MMKKPFLFVLALLFSVGSVNLAQADDPQSYALDKLANAQAQLDRLKTQKIALDKLTKAVKEDLKAAKIRAKAERLQISADTKRQDAAVLVEQTGVAVDLPNLMATKGVQAGVMEYDSDKEDIDLMFKDKAKQKAVFFPGGDAGRKIQPSNGKVAGIESDNTASYVK